MVRILDGADDVVSRWVWQTYAIRPITLDRAIGILNDQDQLVGALLLSNYNGFNIEGGYYGKDTVTFNLCRWIAQYCLNLGVSRVTILTSKKNKHIINFLTAIHARLEGVSRCYYGAEDRPRNTAVRFVMFRADLARLGYGPNNNINTKVHA